MVIRQRGNQSAKLELLEELKKADRTAADLMIQGYTKSDVRYCLPMLVKEGIVFRYGVGKKAFYTLSQMEINSPATYTGRRINPVLIDPVYMEHKELAFRMGFTDIVPTKARFYRGFGGIEDEEGNLKRSMK